MIKRQIYAFLVVLLIILSSISACTNNKAGNNMNNDFTNSTNYSKDSLDILLTEEYDINEITLFFEGSNANEYIGGLHASNSALTFHDVNKIYPVEVIRNNNYSVYKITQGGYYYVFWTSPLFDETNTINNNTYIYFSAYISSTIEPTKFDFIKPGISTANDVKEIDPAFELSFLMSNGIYSFSFLNNDSLLKIEYFNPSEKISEYDDLVVQSIEIIDRIDSPSKFSSILPDDLP